MLRQVFPQEMLGFLKWWVSPTTMGFPTKNDQHLGCEMGETHHLREHPNGSLFSYRCSLQWLCPLGSSCSAVSEPRGAPGGQAAERVGCQLVTPGYMHPYIHLLYIHITNYMYMYIYTDLLWMYIMCRYMYIGIGMDVYMYVYIGIYTST